MQKEIQNDEDSQSHSVWNKHSNQEKNKDFWKDTRFLEMKGALKETMCRTQVKLHGPKKCTFLVLT